MATDPVGDLLTLLDIERLELDLFRGQSPDEEESQRVFGGQVIAQALVAAYRTVPDDTIPAMAAASPPAASSPSSTASRSSTSPPASTSPRKPGTTSTRCRK